MQEHGQVLFVGDAYYAHYTRTVSWVVLRIGDVSPCVDCKSWTFVNCYTESAPSREAV